MKPGDAKAQPKDAAKTVAPSAVVLLSGGLDSATAAAWAAREGYRLSALSIDYGQRHRCELDASRAVARALGISDHVVLPIDLAAFGGSALVDPSTPVPKDRSDADIGHGVNAIDYSGYPDCRPEFLTAFQEVARLGTKAGVEGRSIKLVAPLVTLSKAEIIRLGLSLGLDYGLTTSCYDPDSRGRPCGRCDSCLLRAAGFATIGATDPRAGL